MTQDAIKEALIFLLERCRDYDRHLLVKSAGDRPVALGDVMQDIQAKYGEVIASLKDTPAPPRESQAKLVNTLMSVDGPGARGTHMVYKCKKCGRYAPAWDAGSHACCGQRMVLMKITTFQFEEEVEC